MGVGRPELIAICIIDFIIISSVLAAFVIPGTVEKYNKEIIQHNSEYYKIFIKQQI